MGTQWYISHHIYPERNVKFLLTATVSIYLVNCCTMSSFDSKVYGCFFASFQSHGYPITCGTLTDQQIATTFSAERWSVDVISTDFDSSVEGSTCSASSLWESSDHGDITGDNSTEFSGTVSEYGVGSENGHTGFWRRRR